MKKVHSILYTEKILRDNEWLTVKDIIRILDKHYDIQRGRASIYSDLTNIERLYPMERIKRERKTYIRLIKEDNT